MVLDICLKESTVVQKMKTRPIYVDNIATESLSGPELSDSTHLGWTFFTGILAVETKKQEDVVYTLMLNRWPSRQQSKLRIREPIRIYPNGYYENFRYVFVENYWSWSEKVGALLPLDFKPLEK